MIHKSMRIFYLYPAVLVSAFVCVILAFAAYVAFHHWKEMSFAATSGVVDSIDQTVPTGVRSGGPTLHIRYHYTVANRQYKGYRICFVEAGEGWQLHAMRQFPVGAHPTVFYNPADPADSVLIRGTQASELCMALFLMPFVAIMLAIWFAIVASFSKGKRFLGVRLYDKGTTARIRPWPWYPIAAATAGLGLGALVVFAFLISATEGDPSLATARAAWVGVFAITIIAGATAGVWVKAKARQGTPNKAG